MIRISQVSPAEWTARLSECAFPGGSYRRLTAPVRFDDAIGYWTGEPDWAHLTAALARFLVRAAVQQLIIAETAATVDGSPASWLPRGDGPGLPLILQGEKGAWLVQITPDGAARFAAATPAAAALLQEWASDERLELHEEGETGWG